MFRDVTKEYVAQTALRDNALQIQTILNTVVDGIISVNDHGIVETINPAGERIFGYAATEIIGQHIKMMIPESHHAQFDDDFEHHDTPTSKARIIGRREVDGQHKDGSIFPDRTVGE